MKKCSNCKIEKSKRHFLKRKKSKDGLDSRCKQCQKDYYYLNKHKINKQRKQHYQENREELLKNKKIYADSHKLEKAKYDVTYRKQNKSKIAHSKKQWEIKHKNDPDFKIRRNLRRRIHHALRDNQKSDNTLTLLGCTVEYFKSYLESKFLKGMSWKNYGKYGWHIDHIIPCNKFDLKDFKQQKQCFHYTNMQPLWWKDNLIKGRN